MATVSKDDILGAIDSMTVLELSELVEALKEKYNVTGAPMAMAMGPAADGANGAAAEVEQTEFTVHLDTSGQQKIRSSRPCARLRDLACARPRASSTRRRGR